MLDIFIKQGDDSYSLTTLGILVLIVIAISCIIAAGMALSKKESKQLNTKQLTFCGVAIALAYLASYIQLFKMPFGGSITFFSMLFICFIGYCFGLKAGLLSGLAYGILQFLQEPYILTFFQVCCDYLLAFTALGLSGLFAKSKHGLIKGYLVGIFFRGIFHSIGGYIYWMSSIPPTFPTAFTRLYPLIYNFSYIGIEGILTIIVLLLPPVSAAFSRIKRLALE